MAKNQNVSFTFSINNDNFNSKVQAMNKEMKTFEQEIKQASNEVLMNGKNVETLGNKYTAINKALEIAKDKVKVYEQQIEKQNSSIEKSKNKLEELGKKKEEVNQKYDESVKATGKESEASLKLKEELDKLNQQYKNTEKSITSKEKTLQNYAVSLSQAETQVSSLEVELKNCSDAIEEQSNKFANASKKFAEVGSSFEKVGGNLQDLGSSVRNAGALIVGAGTALGKMALDAEKDLSTLGGRLGVTAEEAENLKQVAKNLYTNGFGESLEDCVNDLVLLQQNIQETSNMTDEQKGKLLEQISTVKTLFGVESEEITRTLNNMLQNGVIENIEEGLDLITVGFQNGLNSGGDLLDVLYEYSPQFKKLGLNGQDALEMIKAGLDAGGYNADKMADALKELSVRVIDGSNTTKEGFEAIGLNADEMAKKFAAGGDTAKQALNETIEGLKNMEDPIKQDLAGVSLFGTMWEDSSKDAILAMSNIGIGLGDITDATKKAGEEVNNSVGKQFTSSIRKLKDSLLPLGEALLPILDDVIDGVGDISTAISKLDPEVVSSVAKFGAMALVFGTVTQATGSLVTTLGKGATGLSTFLEIAGNAKELGSFTKALASSETALGELIKGFTGLSSAVGLSSSAILPVVGVLAAVTAGVYAWKEGNEAVNSTLAESNGEYSGLEKVMASLMGVQLRSREELEELGLVYKDFNENISNEFQDSVKDMTSDIHEFGLAMGEIKLDGVFSDEEANAMTSRVDGALNSALNAINSKTQEMQDGLRRSFGLDGVIDENEAALLEYWNNRSEKEKEEAQNLQNEINNIITTARNENRTLTSEEEAKIRDYYAQIKQIELEALASNQYEIAYATQEFQNRISTMDAESAKKLLGQRYEQYKEQQIATKTNYDTLISMFKENYDNLSQEDKNNVDETIKRLEAARDEELRLNKEKYDANLQYAYEHNKNLKTEFNRFTGELVSEKDRAYYEEYEQMMSHYQDIETLTEGGYKKMYNTATQTWEDLYISIDEETGSIKGFYDLNTQNLITMNKNNQGVLADEVAAWQQTAAGTLANCLIIGDAYVDAQGNISNASGEIIGKLVEVQDENGNVVSSIQDVNGNPIEIGENTADVIQKLKNTQQEIKNTDGKTAKVTVEHVTNYIQKYNNQGPGHTKYANGTENAKGGIANVNEVGWELIDTPKDTCAITLGRALQGDMAYIPAATKISSHLSSTQKMNAEITSQVNNKMNSLMVKTMDKYLSDILKEMKGKKKGDNGGTVNVQKVEFPHVTSSDEIERALLNIDKVAKQRVNVRK